MICTDKQIEELEARYKLKLPAAYIAFLKGKYPEVYPILTGSDYGYSYLVKLRNCAEELLQENGNPFQLAQNDFVFIMHQGYQFLFFPCGEDTDNPPVYYYLEGEPDKELKFDRFTDWIELLKEEVILYKISE